MTIRHPKKRSLNTYETENLVNFEIIVGIPFLIRQ